MHSAERIAFYSLKMQLCFVEFMCHVPKVCVSVAVISFLDHDMLILLNADRF